jgi:hypothetical protein
MVWNEKKVDETLRGLRSACIENGETFDDSMAFDIADGVLASEDGLEDYLRNVKGIQEPIAYVANYIG